MSNLHTLWCRIVAVCALTAVATATIARQTLEDVKERSTAIFSALGVTVEYGGSIVGRDPQGRNAIRLSASEPASGIEYIIIADANGFVIGNGSRLLSGGNRASRRQRPRLEDAVQASSFLKDFVDRVKGNRQVERTRLAFRLDEVNSNGRTRSGIASATYSLVIGGYRYLDSQVGVFLSIDPYDGRLVSFRESWKHPTIVSSVRTLSEAQAKAKAVVAAGQAGQSVSAAGKLGFASDYASRRSFLCWMFEADGPMARAGKEGCRQIFVHASTGAIIKS